MYYSNYYEIQENLLLEHLGVENRSDSESYLEENTERYQLNKEFYRKRQATVEHQFGIIKRQRGFD